MLSGRRSIISHTIGCYHPVPFVNQKRNDGAVHPAGGGETVHEQYGFARSGTRIGIGERERFTVRPRFSECQIALPATNALYIAG